MILILLERCVIVEKRRITLEKEERKKDFNTCNVFNNTNV
jgi:hypothetical protein